MAYDTYLLHISQLLTKYCHYEKQKSNDILDLKFNKYCKIWVNLDKHKYKNIKLDTFRYT